VEPIVPSDPVMPRSQIEIIEDDKPESFDPEKPKGRLIPLEDDIEDTDKPLDSTDTADSVVAPSPHQQKAERAPGSGLAGGISKKKAAKKKVTKKTDGK